MPTAPLILTVTKRLARLPKTAFATTYSGGKLLRHPLLHVRVLRRGDGSEAVSVAFAVGKKLGKATVRNHLRRRMRAALLEESRDANARDAITCEHLQGGETPLEKLRGANLVFVASPSALEADFLALRAAISELMRRAASR